MKAHALWAVTCKVGQVFLNGVILKAKELRRFEASAGTLSATFQKACLLHLQQGSSRNLKLVLSADALQTINRRLLENKYNKD